MMIMIDRNSSGRSPCSSAHDDDDDDDDDERSKLIRVRRRPVFFCS
jgi:hypothetical protein